MKKIPLLSFKSDRLRAKLSDFHFSPKIIFFFMGIASTLWFLIRVIPKPQRAGYPCMRAAAPVMSGFVVYLITLGGSVIFFKKAFAGFKKGRYIAAAGAFIVCLVLLAAFNIKDARDAFSSTEEITWDKGVLPDGANNPMGTGFGIFPGRVAWAWNPASTKDNCANTISDAYFMAKNNNQFSINSMADQAIKTVGGKSTVKESWDEIFKSFNLKKTGTASGYTAGQTIFIKVNNGQAGWAINYSNLAETGNNSATGVKNAAMTNTTPATVLAIVRQLVDTCGIPQDMIYIGEPMTHVYKSLYDAIHPGYPNVKILDKDGYTNLGRVKSSGWTNDAIKWSDKGDEMPDAVSDKLMNELYNASYLIPIAALKAHARGGVTLCAKLHFGSHGRNSVGNFDSFHLHAGLICTVDNDVMSSGVRGDYHMYRVLTDIMGHEKLGRNSLIFIVDGLWGGIEATDMPVKWKTAPFNTDWPSSLFMSQDEVALESVCIDFLRAEANVNAAFKNRPFFPAVDDYLHQAADQANWPTGFTYDPEGDGTPMPASLGVHEHWNSDADKMYSKNLSNDGKGIELVEIIDTVTVAPSTGTSVKLITVEGVNVYPNPCTASAEIAYYLKTNASVEYKVISMDGKIISTFRKDGLTKGRQVQSFNTSSWPRGSYVIAIRPLEESNLYASTVRLMVK
jgi:hypothetical protein